MTIDWSKPLRTTVSKIPAALLHFNGQYVVSWTKLGHTMVEHVDGNGCRRADVRYPGFLGREWGSPVVENVPESPRDHVILFKRKLGDRWEVDDYLVTKEQAERNAAQWGCGPAIAVKVPV